MHKTGYSEIVVLKKSAGLAAKKIPKLSGNSESKREEFHLNNFRKWIYQNIHKSAYLKQQQNTRKISKQTFRFSTSIIHLAFSFYTGKFKSDTTTVPISTLALFWEDKISGWRLWPELTVRKQKRARNRKREPKLKPSCLGF